MLSMHSFDDRPSSLTALWDDGGEKDHLYMICLLSSRQVKYLKLGVDDAYISFWSVGIFLCTPFLFIFAYSLVFWNRVFCRYIR